MTDDQQHELELKLLNHEKANPQPPLKRPDGTVIEAGESPILPDGEDD